MSKKQTRQRQNKKQDVAPGSESVSMADQAGESLPNDPSHAEVARRAHQIWMDGGCQPNCEYQNWLEAETQLRAERQMEAD